MEEEIKRIENKKRKVIPYLITSVITAVITAIIVILVTPLILKDNSNKKETTYTNYYWVENFFIESNIQNINKLYHLKYLKITIQNQGGNNEQTLISYDQPYSKGDSLDSAFGKKNGITYMAQSFAYMIPKSDKEDFILNSSINFKDYVGIVKFNVTMYIEDELENKYNFNKSYTFEMKEENEEIYFRNLTNSSYSQKASFDGIQLDNYTFVASIIINKRTWIDSKNQTGWIN